MENRKGNGIFLGVISVATLIVAMIGATFAYFSATTESAPNAIDLGAYEFKLSLDVIPIYPEDASALIPLNPNTVIENAQAPNNTNLLYALNVAENKCIDDNGLQVCALYQVIIENEAPNPVTLSGSIKTISNDQAAGETSGPFENLTYQAISGDHTKFDLVKVGNPVTLDQNLDGLTDIASINVPGATTNAEGATVNGVGTGYVLIYLNDTAGDTNPDNDNQSSEMGAKYTGQLIYTSKSADGSASATLTGTFKVAAPEEDEKDQDAGV